MATKHLIRCALSTLLICAGAAPCFATDPWDDCAFLPDVRSQVSFSLLDSNPTLGTEVPFTPLDGLRHPVLNWRTFAASLVEAFAPGERHKTLLQYNYADSAATYALEANIITGYDHRLDDPGDYGFLYKGLRVNSRYNGRLRMRATWWNGKFHGDKSEWLASPLIDGYNNQNPDGSLLDNVNGELSYGGEHFKAALGRGKFQLGNSLSGSVALSGAVNEYDYLLLEQNFGVFRFSFLGASLDADSTLAGSTEGEYPAKFLAVHQLTCRPRNWIDLYLGETVIYGGTSDLSYMLPLYFWRVGKYGLRDRDNLMLFAGANIQPQPDLTLYLNCAIDELTYNKWYTNWWGNKFALQTGAALQMPGLALVSGPAPRCAMEFTAIRPWTYTHYANVSMYSHDRQPLGYPKGSNLLDLTAELNLPLPAKLRWDSQLSATWQGSEGNDWRLNYQDYFPSGISATAEADWLGGEVDFNLRWQNTLRVGILAHHTFLLGHRSDFGGAARHQVFGSWQFSF